MNIHDIAKLAGVSSTTVSRYLNDGYVSKNKREIIQKVIDQTGYTPLLGAQAMRTRQKKLIGVIIPKISSESVSRTVDGISETLSSHGYQILLGNTDNNPEKELEYLSIFQTNTDGILFMATILTERHRAVLQKSKIPVVLIGQRLENYNCLYYHDLEAAKELTSFLINSGYRNLGYIGVTTNDRAVGMERKTGFLTATREAHLDISPERMLCGPFRMESGKKNMELLLKKFPTLDGVFCATDSIAIGAMQAISAHGLSVPHDIGVVGIGDSQLSKIVTPHLTTVHFHYRASGLRSADMLFGMLKKHTRENHQLALDFELMIRGSCIAKQSISSSKPIL